MRILRATVAPRFLLFVAVSLLARGPLLVIPILDRDEACYMAGAREMLGGRQLYVDLADQHPPGAYLFYAAAQALTGLGMLGVRLLAILVVVPLTALAAPACFRHARRAVGDRQTKELRSFRGVRGFTIVGSRRSGRLRMKKLPVPQHPGTGSSFEMVAGAGFEPATFGL
jgi:hypothetical protein